MPLVPSSEILVTCVHQHKCLMQLLIVMVYQIILQSTLNVWVWLYVTLSIQHLWTVCLNHGILTSHIETLSKIIIMLPMLINHVYFGTVVQPALHSCALNPVDSYVDFAQMLCLIHILTELAWKILPVSCMLVGLAFYNTCLHG